MREREFIMPPPEESEDSSGEKNEKKDKKKNRFERALELILPKKGAKEADEGEQDKAGFFERALEKTKGSFGRLFGIETEELPEEEDSVGDRVEEEAEPYTPWFRLGNMNFISTDASEVHPEQNANEQTEPALADSPESETNDTPQTIEGGETTEISDTSSPSREELPVVEIEHGRNHRAQEEAETANSLQREAAIRPVTRENLPSDGRPEQVQPQTVVERRGGAGAALVGFVAAETLSRHRDKKIRKQAKQMDREVKSQAKELESQSYELKELQQRQKEQRAELQHKRAQDTPENIAQPTQRRPEVRPTQEKQPGTQKEAQANNPETRPAAKTPIPEKDPVARKTVEYKNSSSIDEEKRKLEGDRVSPISPEERWHLEQIEQAAEQDVALESYYERRHEAKDVPSTHGGNSTGYTYQHSTDDVSGPYSNKDATNTHVKQSSSQVQQTKDEYKTAAKQGAIAGVAIVIAVAIVLLVASLL